MANTGRKIYQFLKQVDADTMVATGLRKANTVGDPDYVAPVADFATCPIISWQAINPFCELDEDSNNTGMKGYANRARLTNGSLDGYTEPNINGVGLGPYFAPVSDIITCPLPIGPPPPPPPPTANLSIENHVGSATITGFSGILYTPISGSIPIVAIGTATGLHGAAPSGTVTITTSGAIPAGFLHMKYFRNGILITSLPATTGATYNIAVAAFSGADIIRFDLST